MADNKQSQMVDEFCKVTGVDNRRAQLYLEASAWNLDLALSSFFEETDEDAEHNSSLGAIPDLAKSSTSQPPTRFATLASLMGNENREDEEEGQAFYAGGSERSGQQVLGPGKRKAGPDIVEEMFKAAKSHGAQVVDPAEGKGKMQSSPFWGTGYKLGSTEGDVEIIAGPGPGPTMPNTDHRPVDICLKMWKSGFSVDDGPHREYSDPSNAAFLESIRRGEIPQELVRQARGEVNLNMEDHRHEDFIPPKASVHAFSGTGYRLGSPTPPILGAQPGQQTPADHKKNEDAAKQMLRVDDSQPTTNLQVRLTDGSRLVINLNHSHTVGDIRRYIVTARPEYSASVFTLMTTYPNKELADDNASLKEANLLNAVIVQKLN